MPARRTVEFILFVAIGIMIGGCATVPKRPPVSEKEGYSLKEICAQNDIQWTWDQVAQVITLSRKGVRAKMLVGSELVLVEDTRILLSAPVKAKRSAIIVPPDFRAKIVDLLQQRAAQQRGYALFNARKIIIDAGHGGKDPGTIGYNGLQEKGVVLDISRRVADLLKERGFKVKMTRETDEFLSLEERTAFTSRENADLFVSIHANASPSRSVYGLETYSSMDLGFIDRIATQRKQNESMIFNNLEMKRGDPELENIVSDLLYTNKQYESARLADRMAKKVAKDAKTKNRGAKEARFFVLRNTLIPAILVEVGFLSNSKEEKLFESSDYRQLLAQSLAQSITDYAYGLP